MGELFFLMAEPMQLNILCKYGMGDCWAAAQM